MRKIAPLQKTSGIRSPSPREDTKTTSYMEKQPSLQVEQRLRHPPDSKVGIYLKIFDVALCKYLKTQKLFFKEKNPNLTNGSSFQSHKAFNYTNNRSNSSINSRLPPTLKDINSSPTLMDNKFIHISNKFS